MKIGETIYYADTINYVVREGILVNNGEYHAVWLVWVGKNNTKRISKDLIFADSKECLKRVKVMIKNDISSYENGIERLKSKLSNMI